MAQVFMSIYGMEEHSELDEKSQFANACESKGKPERGSHHRHYYSQIE